MRNKLIILIIVAVAITGGFSSCVYEPTDIDKQTTLQKKLEHNQSTPKDIDFSIKRYLLMRRAYHLNGLEEKADNLICPIIKPLGYIALYQGNILTGVYTVDGLVVSLGNWLSPESEYYEYGSSTNKWLADPDGTYGDNGSGVFFFTPDGKYMEHSGTYTFSDKPFIVNDGKIVVEINQGIKIETKPTIKVNESQVTETKIQTTN